MLIFANYLALNRKYISASSYSFEMFLPGPKRWTVWPDWQTDVDVHRAMLLLWRQKSLNSVDACDSSLENSHLKILKPCSMNPTLNLKQCGPARLRWMLMRLVLHSFDRVQFFEHWGRGLQTDAGLLKFFMAQNWERGGGFLVKCLSTCLSPSADTKLQFK